VKQYTVVGSVVGRCSEEKIIVSEDCSILSDDVKQMNATCLHRLTDVMMSYTTQKHVVVVVVVVVVAVVVAVVVENTSYRLRAPSKFPRISISNRTKKYQSFISYGLSKYQTS